MLYHIGLHVFLWVFEKIEPNFAISKSLIPTNMKKVLVLILTCITLISFLAIESVDAKSRKHADIDVVIVHRHKPHIHRSAVPDVEACYDSEASTVEVEFNDNFGPVVIYVLNPMQQAVAKYDCNTDMEPFAAITCDLEEMGIYTLKIVGKGLEAEGYFSPAI